MQNDEQKQPPYSAEKHIERKIRAQKLARFAPVCLSYKQQHRRRKRRFKLRKAIHIRHRHRIEHRIEQSSSPFTQAFGQRRKYQTNQIEVEKQLQIEVFVHLTPFVQRQRKPCTKHPQYVHEYEKCPIHAYRMENLGEKFTRSIEDIYSIYHSWTKIQQEYDTCKETQK